MSEGAVWAIWGLPLAAFVVIAAGVPTGIFRRTPRLAAAIALVTMFGSFVLSVIALREVWAVRGESIGYGTHPWLELGNLTIDIGIRLDGLTAMMLVVVTAVSFLVQFYSAAYIAGDKGFARYYAIISLFAVAMLGLVLADNLLMVFIFWELVGLCSYLLIGHWFERDSAVPDQLSPRAAAKKAFLITRLGDVGFLLALILIFSRAGTFNIGELQEMAHGGALSQTTLLLFCLGIFAGAAGKSAQVPFHTWLPDAMAGPTPVSALIHAATMVAAGVYLVGRLFPIFEATDHALTVVAIVGGVTAVLAASMGMVMSDIKRVLAYSTISQLGYMMLALGVFGYVAAFFHLMTHAFFKALLFLGSGSVSHATNTFDMRLMGGLRRTMPITFLTFVIGSLSLAGIVPLAGFWSKDEILLDAKAANLTYYVVLLVVAFMTAFYMFRAVSMTFLGEYRGGAPDTHHGSGHAPAHAIPDAHDDAHAVSTASVEEPTAAAHTADHHGKPHESPWMMALPLLILAVPAIAAGFLNAGVGPFGRPFGQLVGGALPPFAREGHALAFDTVVAATSTVVALAGVVGALVVYGFGTRWRVGVGPLKPLYALASRRYFLDDLYERGVAQGLVVGGLGGIGRLLDGRIFDEVVNGAAAVTRRVGSGLARVQNGQTQTYALVAVSGVVLVAAVMFAVAA